MSLINGMFRDDKIMTMKKGLIGTGCTTLNGERGIVVCIEEEGNLFLKLTEGGVTSMGWEEDIPQVVEEGGFLIEGKDSLVTMVMNGLVTMVMNKVGKDILLTMVMNKEGTTTAAMKEACILKEGGTIILSTEILTVTSNLYISRYVLCI